MLALKVAVLKSWSSKSMLPLQVVKRPRTFEMTMWRTQKLILEWVVSMSQVSSAIGAPSAALCVPRPVTRSATVVLGDKVLDIEAYV